MMRTALILIGLGLTALIGWQYSSTTINSPTTSTEEVQSDLVEDQKNIQSNEPTLTEAQQQDITSYNEQMQSLTKVEPVQVPQVPTITQSIHLPELKSLTESELTEPDLRLNPDSAIGTQADAPPVNTETDSKIITSTSTPVIESVSRQTGIPAQDIEAAFNQ